MLRLDYLFMRECLPTDGDNYKHKRGYKYTAEGEGEGEQVNRIRGDECDYFIESFANRDNNGTQPVPDDFPVVITWRDSYFSEKTTASEVRWKFDFEWKPDYNRLLEQQDEYDKQQEKPIEEIMINAKESKISKFKEHQEVFVRNNTDKDWIFGCETSNGKSYIILSHDGHIVVNKDHVSDKPFKSDYELKKEQLMKEQIQKASKLLTNKGFGHDQILLKCLQSNGFFAEIIMPLGFKNE